MKQVKILEYSLEGNILKYELNYVKIETELSEYLNNGWKIEGFSTDGFKGHTHSYILTKDV